MRGVPPYLPTSRYLRNSYSCRAAACSSSRRAVGSIFNVLVGNTANNKPSVPSINQLPTPVSSHARVSTRTRDFHPSTHLPLLRPVNNSLSPSATITT